MQANPSVYEVTVGNIGKVHTSHGPGMADQEAIEWARLARSGNGRATFPVVLWKDGEPVREVTA